MRILALKGVISMEKELFNKSEEALMNFLWDHGKPISIAQISELWEGKDITDHHLRVLLKSLEKKSAIECCGAEPRGRQYSRIFRSKISREEYYARVLDVNGVSLPKLLQVESVALARVGSRENIGELIQSLQEVIDELKEREQSERSKS